MNDLEAAQLAHRLVSGWPQRSAITADEWASELRALDAGIAGATFVRLRRDRTTPPSIAEYLRSYRVLLASARPNVEPVCTLCDGGGWVETDALHIGDGERERAYSQVTPCDCPAGRTARDVRDRINAQAPPLRGIVYSGPPLSAQSLPERPGAVEGTETADDPAEALTEPYSGVLL